MPTVSIPHQNCSMLRLLQRYGASPWAQGQKRDYAMATDQGHNASENKTLRSLPPCPADKKTGCLKKGHMLCSCSSPLPPFPPKPLMETFVGKREETTGKVGKESQSPWDSRSQCCHDVTMWLFEGRRLMALRASRWPLELPTM